MNRKHFLLPLLASLILAFLSPGCGSSSTTPLTPEQSKAIVGEDTDYLPGAGASAKTSKKR